MVTNGPLRPIRAGLARVHFLTKKWVERTPKQPIRTPYGDILVSTPEATAFDLVQYVHRAGHLSNVVTVLIELSEKLDSKKLAVAAQACGEIVAAQRVGYLLDVFTNPSLTSELHDWLEKCRPSVASLRPNWKPNNSAEPIKANKWHLLINEVVEPDL